MAAAIGSRDEIRMILLGKTAEGKSSFGNTITRSKGFKSGISPNGVTDRIFDPRITQTNMQEEVAKAYELTALPGPHAFLLIIEPKTFTPEKMAVLNYFDSLFGPQAINHTIIIFTHADSFDPSEGGTIETYLDALPDKSPLRIVLDQCQWRYLSVNNRGTESEKEKTVENLLEIIGAMISKNAGRVYRTNKFDEVAAVLTEEKAKGNYNPINPDGSIALHPKIEKIIVESFLSRTIGRKVMQ